MIDKKIQIGDIIEVVYGTGTDEITVDRVYDQDDIRGKSNERPDVEVLTQKSEVVRYIGNIMDPEDDDF